MYKVSRHIGFVSNLGKQIQLVENLHYLNTQLTDTKSRILFLKLQKFCKSLIFFFS